MIPLAAALSDQPGPWDALTYQVIGLLVVFTALGSIWFMMELMGYVFRMLEARKQARVSAQPVVPAAPIDLPVAGVRPEIVAVITAAAHASLQAGEHIVAIHPLGHEHAVHVQLGAWSSEGRRQIFAGRKVR